MSTFNERDQLLTVGRADDFNQRGGRDGDAMGLPQAAAVQAAERDETIAEVRQLIVDLRDAAQDGRDLARRYADVLQKVVDEYCDEFEKRAEAALARLEAVR
jgi:hypothetical protein